MADQDIAMADQDLLDLIRTDQSALEVTDAMSDQNALFEFPPALTGTFILLYSAISLLSVVGNLLVIYVVATSRSMHSQPTNLYIANLATADVLIGLFAIPFQFQAILLQQWHLPPFLCRFCPLVSVLSVNVSVLTLVLISQDRWSLALTLARHRAIITPLRPAASRASTRAAICTVWAASLALALPQVPRQLILTLTSPRQSSTASG